MTGWVTTSTGELLEHGVIEIGDGYRAKNAEFVESGGLPFVRVGDVSGTIRTEGIDELPIWNAEKYGAKVSQPFDSLITMKGTVGRVAYVSRGIRAFVYSPQVSYWRSRDHSRIQPRWLRYWLESSEFLSQALATKGATDMADYINLRDQRRMRITVPPILIQRKIAAVLSVYDDFIENNNRRIKILEEMAQRIYREWFVDYRYLGHQSESMVDSELGPIPLGWEVRTLGDLVDINSNTIRKVTSDEEIRYIDIASVSPGVVQAPKKMLLSEAPGRARRRVKSGDILWSTVRPNLRAYALVLSPGSDCVASTGFAVLSPRDASFAYVYEMTTTDAFVEYLIGRATGSAYPAVTPRVFANAPAIIPPSVVNRVFADVAEPLMQLVSHLRTQSTNLRTARDLLLPRLMSGEIDVTDLDIAMREAAA